MVCTHFPNLIYFLVETIIDDHTIERQSEADNNLLKFEILQKKNEFVKNNIKEINDRNTKLQKATVEIDELLETLST
jgi:Na+-translocating ferredoxin:NAD+ oxidoreductase RnfG subunit